ncbi:MAG TPA: ATP-binding cassette domain-containing protein [Candidatus Ratteibacteria bacterium]|uniref:ABC transporter ATP-binding protein YlmA n=1 Tax=candidate division TA06 bacterium ADurb.Bin131 TaxID=1852827 RepID=A0A1V6C935_UNCT6|nr:MAG: putative ABC transporter ATP-binding protein YlmA [candidate division TA06 bacterium ADurb.Bin131]HOC03236.1 ATP-binding cassette domain-containing protein [bacterium]HRS07156.1 ATP-binding cassette domain-containing protein [Candidatus Ratteibacteria bacterium]HON06410.1 ATP-binding cassette domain-containing protein [bacterium]HPC30113.1 ATP-binding cassette domain-containing protein [bacterium]
MKSVIIENASVIRGNKLILEDISFSVKPGECIGIYGSNGAGKTTLLTLINGLLFCKKGRVIIDNIVLSQKTVRQIRIITGYVPQNFEVDPRIPVLSKTVVLSGCYGKMGLFHFPDQPILEKAYGLMKKLDVENVFNRPFGQISGGERQKIMIARAMMQEPEILLLDEPFSSVSHTSKEKIIEIIKNWHKEKGLTIFLVSHEKNTIEKLCNRVFYIDNGRITSQETIHGTI